MTSVTYCLLIDEAEKTGKQMAELKSTIVELQKTISSNDKNLQSLADREMEAKQKLEENNMTWKSLLQSEKMVYENKVNYKVVLSTAAAKK